MVIWKEFLQEVDGLRAQRGLEMGDIYYLVIFLTIESLNGKRTTIHSLHLDPRRITQTEMHEIYKAD